MCGRTTSREKEYFAGREQKRVCGRNILWLAHHGIDIICATYWCKFWANLYSWNYYCIYAIMKIIMWWHCIYSWKFWPCFDSFKYYDFTRSICSSNIDPACRSPGLFVAPATRGFCVTVKRLNGHEICYISVHHHSAGTCKYNFFVIFYLFTSLFLRI